MAAAERALERLFRLTVNRKVHTKQTAAVGVDVTRAGYAVLRTVDELGEATMGEIARQCSMDPAAAGRQVKALEDDGLVQRNADDGDARVTVVRMTRRGGNRRGCELRRGNGWTGGRMLLVGGRRAIGSSRASESAAAFQCASSRAVPVGSRRRSPSSRSPGSSSARASRSRGRPPKASTRSPPISGSSPSRIAER